MNKFCLNPACGKPAVPRIERREDYYCSVKCRLAVTNASSESPGCSVPFFSTLAPMGYEDDKGFHFGHPPEAA